RLVVAEPGWRHLADRARVYSYYERPAEDALALRDAFEATKLTGLMIIPFDGHPEYRLARNKDLSVELYTLAARWETAKRQAGLDINEETLAIATYRL